MKRTHKPVNQAFCGARHAELQERVITAAQATGLSVPDLLRIGALRVIEEFERTGQIVVRSSPIHEVEAPLGRRPHPLFG